MLEWAVDDGGAAGGSADLDVLRERVKAGFGDGKDERPGRKRKLDLDVAGTGEEDGEQDDFVAV